MIGARSIACALVALAACGSYSTYRTTRIAKPGHTEWLFGAQASGAAFAGEDAAGAGDDKAAAPLPEVAVAARRSVVPERIEIQVNGTLFPVVRAWTGSLELAGKLRVGAIGRWSLAVGAGAQYRLAESGGAYIEGATVSVPVIGGVDLGRHQLVFAIVGGYQRWWSSGARPVSVPFLGDSLGFLWRINARWSLLPEIGVAHTPTANFMTEDSRLFHFGVAAMWTR